MSVRAHAPCKHLEIHRRMEPMHSADGPAQSKTRFGCDSLAAEGGALAISSTRIHRPRRR
eukprot:448345-Pleurochrysis_carterae.AAC.2